MKTRLNWIGLFLFFALTPDAFGLISPSTLQIVTSSVGPIIQQILIFLIAILVGLFLKAKKRLRKNRLLFLGVIVIVGVAGLSVFQSPSLSQSDMEILDSNEFHRIEYANHLDINEIDFSDYVLIDLLEHDHVHIKNHLLQTNIYNIKYLIKTKKIKAFLSSINVSKKTPLLFYCNVGWSSKAAAYFLNKLGYNTFYVDVQSLNEIDHILVNYPIKNESSKIVNLLNLDNKVNYTILIFNSIETHTCYIAPNIKKIQINPSVKLSKDYSCKISKVSDINSTEVLCLTPLQCALSSRYVDSPDVIYYLELGQ